MEDNGYSKKKYGSWVAFDTKDLPAEIYDVEKKKMEEWTFTTLQLVIGENFISEISMETTIIEIWTKLENLYIKKSLTNRLILRKTLFIIKLREDASVKMHLSFFNDHVMKIKTGFEGG